jgi:hypothetical protein
LHPTVGDTARNLLPFVIQWTKRGFDAVKLEYTVDGGANWKPIADNVTDTFYVWTTPNVNTNQAQVRITPIGVTDVPSITSPQFTMTGGASVWTDILFPVQIVSAFPNPGSTGSSVTLSVHAPNSAVIVELLDLLGNRVGLVQAHASDEGTIVLPTKSLTAGTYVVRLTDGVTTDSKRIVIR